jgi:hypothetical protein
MKRIKKKNRNNPGSNEVIKAIGSRMAAAFEPAIHHLFDEITCTTLKQRYSNDEIGRSQFVTDSKAKIEFAFRNTLKKHKKEKSSLFESFNYLLELDEVNADHYIANKENVDPTEVVTTLRHLLAVGTGYSLSAALLHGCVPKSEQDQALEVFTYRALELMQFWQRLNREYFLLDRCPAERRQQLIDHKIFKNLKRTFAADVKNQLELEGVDKAFIDLFSARVIEVTDDIFLSVADIATLRPLDITPVESSGAQEPNCESTAPSKSTDATAKVLVH